VKRLATPAGAVAIFLLNVWLCGPLFYPGELPFRGSIEGGYVAMARFLSDHPNPWGWNPLPYCGLPTQFLYVPVLPYGTALLLRLLPHLGPDTVYPRHRLGAGLPGAGDAFPVRIRIHAKPAVVFRPRSDLQPGFAFVCAFSSG
jgi:hypothetical protein